MKDFNDNNGIINFVCIMDISHFIKLKKWLREESNMIKELTSNYKLSSTNKTFYCVEISMFYSNRTLSSVIQYIYSSLEYIMLRFEDSPVIVLQDNDKLEELIDNIYRKPFGLDNFKKDFLTTKERYTLIMKTLNKTGRANYFSMVYNHPKGIGTYNINISDSTKELFMDESEIMIADDLYGTIELIDYSESIPKNYFKLKLLKKLEIK